MKRFLLILGVLMLTVLAACGDSSDKLGEESEKEAKTENVSNDETEEAEDIDEDEGETMTADENETEEADVGDKVTSEAGEATLVSRTDDIGTFESGPIKLTIEKANGVSMAVDDDYYDFFETDQLEYIQVDLEVENTSEDNVTFYASQAIMTTSTGEQLEPDMLMSDHIDGEYYGEVNKSGSSFYFLEKSDAEDVESIRLMFSAASDESFEDLGEDIDIEVELDK